MKKTTIIILSTFLISSCSMVNSNSTNSSQLSNYNESDTSNLISNSISTSIREGEKEIIVNGKKDIDQEAFYDEFYDYTSDIEITLKFKNQSIYNLAKYSSDENKKDMYHPCDMIIYMNGTNYIFNEVGARMKGNTSRNDEFVDSNGIFNAPVHFKISVSQTFDDDEDNDYYIRSWDNDELRSERKKRRVGDAKKFDIKYNKNIDNTFTRQIYAYHAFDEEGLIVQRNNLVKVNIYSETDKMTQLYELQECIDSEFIERRYSEEEASGNLYKCTYTDKGPADLTHYNNNVIGVEAPNYHPSYDLKTNDDEEDHTLLKNLINSLNNDMRSASEYKETFDSLVNAEEFIKFLALSWVIGNPDDIRNNSNNYYMYFNSNDNKAVFIPYDFDRCFGILKDWPIHMEEIPHYTTKQNTGNRHWQKNPIFWRTIISTTDTSVDYSKKWEVIKEYQDQYNLLCKEYADKYLDVSKYEAFNNQFIYSNKNIEVGGADNLSFEEYANAKKNTFN